MKPEFRKQINIAINDLIENLDHGNFISMRQSELISAISEYLARREEPGIEARETRLIELYEAMIIERIPLPGSNILLAKLLTLLSEIRRMHGR